MIRTWGRSRPKVHPKAFVHDSAEVIGKVVIKAGASVWPLCSLRGDLEPIIIGERTNVQDLTVIHTHKGRPTRLGREITVGHNVILHGCRIGDRTLVGMGAVVMEADIGSDCLVAAGSLVLAGFVAPKGSVVMGSPARVVRTIKKHERARILKGMRSYVRNAEIHRRNSQAVIP